MIMDDNNHSVFRLRYHLVLVIKYRREVIDTEINNRLKEMFERISPNHNITMEEWKNDKDHIQVSFKAHPNSELSKFINGYKSATSRIVKKEFPEIREKLWKEAFWSKSYCMFTTGEAPIEVIENYLETQNKKEK